MQVVWFLVALTFFILWLRARSSNALPKDMPTDSYGQGYWDGYRAFGDKVARMLERGIIDSDKLRRMVDEGNGETQSVMEQPSEMIGIIPENADKYDDRPVATNVQETSWAQPVLSQEEVEAEKEKRTLQNLNTILYVGSFLIVAAAGVFVTLVMPAAIKLLGLILVTGAFYVSGLVLYRRSERLRPAAVAFVGTGLAILPFVGFALNLLGGMSGASAWFITSIVGLVAYGYAAVRLRSQLISYLTMAFVISLAMSAVSTLGLSIVWYFIVVIGVSLMCNSLHIIWPKLMPQVFAQPIEQTGQVTTPIALVASLFVMGEMELFMYEVLFGIATAHYLVVWLEQRSLLYEIVVRIVAHITFGIVAYDVAERLAPMGEELRYYFGLAVVMLSVVQVIYSLLRVKQGDEQSETTEQSFTLVNIGLVLCGMILWIGLEHAAWLSSLSLAVIGFAALGVTLRFRQTNWAYIGLLVSLVLPFVVGRAAVEPSISYEVLAGGFVALALFVLMGLERAQSLGRSQSVTDMLTVAVYGYGAMTIISGWLTGDGIAIGWTSLLAAGIFGLLSYLKNQVAFETIGAVAGVVAVTALVYESSIGTDWQLLVSVVVSAALLLMVAYAHHSRRETGRRDSLAIVAAVVGVGLVFVNEAWMSETAACTAAVLLLIAGVAAAILRYRLHEHASTLASLGQVLYFAYPMLGIVATLSLGGGWLVLSLAVTTALVWVASYLERVPWLMLVGNVLFTIALFVQWEWLEFDVDWQFHGVMWLSAAAFYAMYWYMVERRDEWRQLAALGSVWAVLGFSTIVGIFAYDERDVLIAAGSLLALATTLFIHGYRTKNDTLAEVAVYLASFSLQRFASINIPEMNIVMYGHWWALTIAFVASWRSTDVKLRLMIALGFVTASSGLYALTGESGYSLIFLIEHVIVVVAGAMLRQQWAMWWGIVATVLAILYFLRDFTVLALLFLGFLLIVFVIWRLTKVGNK